MANTDSSLGRSPSDNAIPTPPTDGSQSSKISTFRRNGQLFSCEPCRLNKLRCDHGTPVCGRCAKRGKPNACVYHPAPLTKAQSRAQPPNKKRKTLSTAPSLVSSSQNPVLKSARRGFLGPTSFSAIFTENNHNLEANEEDLEQLPIVQENISKGAEIISILVEDLAVMRKLMLYRSQVQLSFLPHKIGQLWYEGFPRNLRTTDELRNASWSVWQNTVRPMQIAPDTTMIDWAKQCTGSGLRWEVIGLIAATCALQAYELENWDSLFRDAPDLQVERDPFVNRMRNVSDFCLNFCFECEALNVVYFYFMLTTIALIEVIQGDTHFAAWQRTGELCNALIAGGFHRESPTPLPFWFREVRRRCLVLSYNRDKFAASIFGRPPRLLLRYCQIEPNLALDLDDLLLEGPELQAKLSCITPDGWNSSSINPATRGRVWFRLCCIREKILDIALTSDPDAEVLIKADQIRKELDEFFESYLSKVTPTPSVIREGESSPNFKATCFDQGKNRISAINSLFIHGNFWYTEFIFARALISRRLKEYRELVIISQQLFEIVLLGVSNKQFYNDMSSEYTFLLLTLGLPSSGVLAIELLKQVQPRLQNKDTVLSRSETIQNLSVFVAALASIEPRHGNYSACSQGRRVLRRLLDQILNPPIATTNYDPPPLFDESGLPHLFENDVDFMDWLDNVEWCNQLQDTTQVLT